METPSRLVYGSYVIWSYEELQNGDLSSILSRVAQDAAPLPLIDAKYLPEVGALFLLDAGYTIEFPLEPSFALSRVLREGEPLKYSGNKEEAPCNLAAENRENRKVKMKLQVVKESEVATFSTIYMYIYVYIYVRCYALSWKKKKKNEREAMRKLLSGK